MNTIKFCLIYSAVIYESYNSGLMVIIIMSFMKGYFSDFISFWIE